MPLQGVGTWATVRDVWSVNSVWFRMRLASVVREFQPFKPFVRAGSVICLILAFSVMSGEAQAQSKGLEGYWRGSGYVSPAKGRRERVRCRVWISRASGESYSVKARCASQGANIDQVGRVSKTGGNSYSGDFFNSDFNIRGRIRITLRGNRQAVALSSKEGSGRLTLFRR